MKKEKDDERTPTLRVLRRPNKLLRAISTRPRYTREESSDRRRIVVACVFLLPEETSFASVELRINVDVLSRLTRILI